METNELDDLYKHHKFKPSSKDALTYFLPLLLAGGTHNLIHNADVYACEPKDLAAKYPPVPSTGDRFFFTTCKYKNGKCARVAGAGTWSSQKTEVINSKGVKVGEVKHLSFKKGNASTGWVMKEYRCLLPQAVVAGGEKVLCKIHLGSQAPVAAREESAAYKPPQERAEPPVAQPQTQTVTVTASTHAYKRPAPAAVAAADLSSCKKMRVAAPVAYFLPPQPKPVTVSAHVTTLAPPVYLPAPAAAPVPAPEVEYEDCPALFTSAAPEDAPEGDDDRFCCTMDELFGFQQEQTLPAEAEKDIEELDFFEGIDQLAASSLFAGNYVEEAELQKMCSYNAAAVDLQTPLRQGYSQFF
jgi:hypothetical protein